MPTKGNDVDVLVDTSVAIAFLFEGHAHHAAALRAVGDRTMGFAGHAAFETFSVMTRMPPPARLSPAATVQLMDLNFPSIKFLTASGAEKLLAKFASFGIAGGSVYDALIGLAAAECGLVLLTRDARALSVYRALHVDVEVVQD